jgi:BRCT domain type II-containing protein
MPVTAKPNVVMDLMKVTRNVASRNTPSMTIRDVAATQKPSGLVPTVTVSPMLDTVTVKLSAKIDLMKVKTSAASRNTLTTTSKFVAATQTLNSPVIMVNVSQKLADVMVKPNAKMDLMKVTKNVASTSSPSMMMLDVVVK